MPQYDIDTLSICYDAPILHRLVVPSVPAFHIPPWGLVRRVDGYVYPRGAPCWLFVDELVKAPNLANGGKELAKLLNVVGANVRRLPLHVLAFVTAPDAVVEPF